MYCLTDNAISLDVKARGSRAIILGYEARDPMTLHSIKRIECAGKDHRLTIIDEEPRSHYHTAHILPNIQPMDIWRTSESGNKILRFNSLC